MKNEFLSKAGALLFAGLLMISCSDNDDPATRGQLSISIDNSLVDASAKSAVAAKDINADLSLSEFWINIEEFELEIEYEGEDYEMETESETEGEYEEEWDDDGFYDFEDEIELEGPFEVDLLAGSVELMNISVPVGEFEELEFKFDKSMNQESELFGKSILVKGSYAGTPFVFWHDFNEEVEVDFEDVQQNIVITEGTESITINFDITAIFNHDFGVDLSMATDGNGDGTIEISPMDEDGNNGLADTIKEAIKKHIELLDD
ncbi:hypothetical protein E7Z59_12600 [Robertkochia marina]|uniref:DUF4382 domain-containing protein n=1 Tax=Robertkochia marina TaxID=1227945 RepID=A0A4V3UXZ3_9FLAO|nr:hypothetical protein [Robertkochia marina]THD66624.1 hypothetical protein E7Z59_12600 [Robertkochia marina]